MIPLDVEKRRALRDAVQDLADTPAGQTFLRWLLAETEVLNFFDRPPEPAVLAYAEGKRSIGAKTLELLRRADALHKIITHTPEEDAYA